MKKVNFLLLRGLMLFILMAWIYQTGKSQVINPATLDTNDVEKRGKFYISGYVDAYYGYDFNEPNSGERPYFVTMAKHNEITINLAYIDIKFTSPRFRARLVPGFGAYMNANYAAEDGSMRFLVEANAGVRLFKAKDIWLDVGILGSPYTNESAISKDHLMYTRSFAPEYVPYYLSGAKLTVPMSSKLNLYLYVFNGWQVIRDNNAQKSFGSQLEYRPTNDLLINWDTYIGNEQSKTNPDFRMRYFTDLYFIYSPKGRFSGTACAYIGQQNVLNPSDQTETQRYWWTANIIGRYTIDDNWGISGRLEYFSDPNNVQATLITQPGAFQVGSASLGLNYNIDKNVFIRFESRTFYAENNIYYNEFNQPSNISTMAIGSITISY